MDGEQAPWAFELNIAAMALAGVAWLTLVLGMRWQLRTKAVAALQAWPHLRTSPKPWRSAMRDTVKTAPSLDAVINHRVVCRRCIGLQSRYGGQRFTVATSRRLAVVLWGTTAFRVIHVITEYADHDPFQRRQLGLASPARGTSPGLTISAILTAIMTRRTAER